MAVRFSLALLLVLALARPALAEPVKGGTLRVGLPSNPSSLDPITGSHGSDHHVLFAIYTALVSIDEGLLPRPGLAESWEVSPDLKTYVFKLRKGVRFHDGTAFNAQAVKFQVDRIQNPATKATIKLAEVQSVDVIDDYTVKFTLKVPSVALPLVLADRAGMISSPAAVGKHGADFGRNPVGTGAFKFVEWMQDDHVTLQRFDGYWEKNLPYLDRLEYKVVPDPAVLLTNVRSGVLDFMQEVPEIHAARLRQGSEVKVVMESSPWVRMIYLNSKRPPFDNKLLRQAVNLAIDREGIVKGLFFGLAEVAQGVIPPRSWAYSPDIHPYKRDLARAKEKLAEAGKSNGFRFEMVTINTPVHVQWAEAFKAQLAEAGIEVDIRPMVIAEAAARTTDRSVPYQAAGMAWTGRPEMDDTFTQLFHSSGGFNNGRFGPAVGARINPLVEKARAITDPKVRKELYRQVQTIINDEALDVFFYFRRTIAAMNPKVQNYKVWGDTKMRFNEVWIQK